MKRECQNNFEKAVKKERNRTFLLDNEGRMATCLRAAEGWENGTGYPRLTSARYFVCRIESKQQVSTMLSAG